MSWWCLGLSAALLTQSFRPTVVVPLLAVGTLAGLATRPVRFRSSHPSHDFWGTLTACAGAGLSLVVNARYIGERFITVRDPDIYTLTAQWLVSHDSTTIPVPVDGANPLGFDASVPEQWHPQGNHVTPAYGALHGWLFGDWNVVYAAATGGALALIALYAVSRRVAGPWWGLLPSAGIAMSAPMVLVSRSLYSEPLAMMLICAGALYLISFATSTRLRDAALAGLAFGAVALVRIDGVLAVIAVPFGLAVVTVFQSWDRRPGAPARSRWSRALVPAMVCMAAALPGVAMGLADLAWYASAYFATQRAEIVPLYAGVLGAWGLCLVVPALGKVLSQRALARIGAVLGVVLGVGWFVLATRPFWFVAHGSWDNTALAAMQRAGGLAVDGTRTYAETTLNWMAWYLGWPAVLIGLAVVAWAVIAGTRGGGAVALLLACVAVPSAVLYLNLPSITPDQAWALRRFLPVVMPAVLIGFALAARWLWDGTAIAERSRVPQHASAIWVRQRRVRRWVAGLAVSSMVAVALWSLWPMVRVAEHDGARAGMRTVCDLVADRPVLVVQTSLLPQSIRIGCGVPVAYLAQPEPGAIAAASAALADSAGRQRADVLVITTTDPAALAWTGPPGDPAVVLRFTDWATTLQTPPRGVKGWQVQLWVGQPRPDGSLEPR